MEDLGGVILFTDPYSAHLHQSNIGLLIHLGNIGNIMMCSNPTTEMSLMHTFRCALKDGDHGAIPSFFETLESPSVEKYVALQVAAYPIGLLNPSVSQTGNPCQSNH